MGDREASLVRKHHLQGGSVKNHSKFVNGDLDRGTFLAFFLPSITVLEIGKEGIMLSCFLV